VRTRRVIAAVVVAALTLGSGAACGVPDDDNNASTISPDDVPYGLLGATSSTRPGGNESSSSSPRIFWIDADDELVPRRPRLDGQSTEPAVRLLLAALVDGPSGQTRDLGLGSAVGPSISIRLIEQSGRLALIDVDFGPQEPSADRLPLAMGQIVLTAVSAPGVDQVQITHDGEQIEVPTPGGALKAGALSASDYESLISVSASPR
jgi:hypothetical protein